MELGDDGESDPVEHATKPECFQMHGQILGRDFGQELPVNPDPQVAEQQGDHLKLQPQARVAGAGGDASLPSLAVTAPDAEPFAVHLANLGGSAAHVFIDGIEFAGETMVCALGRASDGTRSATSDASGVPQPRRAASAHRGLCCDPP